MSYLEYAFMVLIYPLYGIAHYYVCLAFHCACFSSNQG